MAQKITPHLWFDRPARLNDVSRSGGEAKEAAEFYVSVFSGGPAESKVGNVTTLHDTPSGDCDVVSFELWGYSFMAISAGPLFKFNPSISFMVNFDPSQDKDAKTRIDAMWAKLSEGGKVLMPLEKYPFSERYGWVEDKYGLSWQLILNNPARLAEASGVAREGDRRPKVMPSLLFVTDTCDKAEEATNFYLSVFKNAPAAAKAKAGTKRGVIARYPKGGPARTADAVQSGRETNKSADAEAMADKEGAIMFTDFQLLGQWFAAMDGSSKMHKFSFNEAISFMVSCDTQEEIDYFWGKLSAAPEAEQCGWLKDKYGVSWQIVPAKMGEMMQRGSKEQIARVTQAFLKMKKFDIKVLQDAYDKR